MLSDQHDRASNGHSGPGQAWPETDGPRVVALAGRNPDSQTVTLILDATTASIAILAIASYADEREAHVREVERYGQTLPEGSYGRRNRQAIAARETRTTARLRAVERPTAWPLTAMPSSRHLSSPEQAVASSIRPTGRSSLSKAPGQPLLGRRG